MSNADPQNAGKPVTVERPDSDQPDADFMMDLLRRLHPLHRTLVSEDMDRAMELIGAALPAGDRPYRLHLYPTGRKVWTWTVPPEYVVHEAYLEVLDKGTASKVLDFKDNPLHLVSYSEPVDRVLSFNELVPHLHVSRERPDAIPWVFKYYDRSWGFCLPQRVFERLPRQARYHAVIRSEFRDGHLRVGEFDIVGTSNEYILFVADVCHPAQVNDSLTGVVVYADLIHRLVRRPPGYYNLKFLFLPETIGSIAYLAHNEALIPKCRFGVFAEMLGNDNTLLLQRTRQDTHVLDRVAEAALRRVCGERFRQGPFCGTIAVNDEAVLNGPGVDIPTISLVRWPYDEYHTSDDHPAMIRPEKLAEASWVLEEIVSLLERDYYPRRRFRGPVFLSGLDLALDWRGKRALKRGLRALMHRLEGGESAVEIAHGLGLEVDDVLAFLGELKRHGLVETGRRPWTAAAEA